MTNIRHYLFILFLHLFIISTSAQITIKELPTYDLVGMDSLFFDVNESRSITALKANWEVYTPEAIQKKIVISIPSTFEGEESLIYERYLIISSEQTKNKNLVVRFLGINYTADVLFNDLVIYKHPGGTQPFTISLPTDIIKADTQNKLTVKVHYELDNKNTIPVEQRFLFPRSRGGLIGDVFLIETNKIFVSKLTTENILSENFSSAKIKIKAVIQNNQKKNNVTEVSQNKIYKLRYNLIGSDGSQTLITDVVDIDNNDSREIDSEFNISSPRLWSPENPYSYRLEAELTLNDSLIDKTARSISIYNISLVEQSLKLNGNDFQIKGTTYFYSDKETGGLVSYKKLEKDLMLIKASGFNTIRFSKVLPSSYSLHLCESIGLFTLVELPINSIPEQILNDDDFSSRVTNHISLMLNQYSGYSSILGFGLGGGYLGKSEEQFNFISEKAELLKNRTPKLVYASFVELPEIRITSLDLAGLELFNATELTLSSLAQKNENYNYPIFISEATYPSFNGNSNGYLNKNSYEAAAKYFGDIIDFTKNNKMNGFVINSFYDYSGDYKSFYSGYNQQNIYSIGLLPNSESTDRISYNVVKSKLNSSEKITIPIGTEKNDSPILFVIIGLVLSIFMALLINSKRKFREDAGRALIRPYNFYADIRDHRLLSGFQTNLLMFVLAGSLSLLFINLLYFLRTNLLLEKILLSFGSPSLIDSIIYLAWYPFEGFFILFLVAISGIWLLSIIIKIFSYSLKTKVYFSSIYYSVIWAFLPLSLLLPLELVLYRVLIADVINPYIYLFIILFILWIGQRLLKGIHVIFDVRPAAVHLYSILLLVLFIGGLIFYFHFTDSTIYHLIRAVSEYKTL